MDRSVLTAALAVAGASAGMGNNVNVLKAQEAAQAPILLPGYSKPGKGKGKRPYHPSSRFVAQDKRDARKARNRRRG